MKKVAGRFAIEDLAEGCPVIAEMDPVSLQLVAGGECVEDGWRPTYDMDNQQTVRDPVYVCDP
jgi:hypothetical protein